MNNKILVALATVSLLLSVQRGFPAEANSVAVVTNSVAAELKDLDRRIVLKMKAGPLTEHDLAAEFKEFDALMEKHKRETQDDLAQILELKAAVYKLVLHDDDKYEAILAQLKRDYPESRPAKQQAQRQKHQEEVNKLQAGLAVGLPFPDFNEKDVTGHAVSLANYKGKVVLIDFWATWCGPCKAELPNVVKTYGKYHDQGFEVIGVSLDQDQGKLESFTSKNNMPWQQFFDGQGWKNKLAVKYFVESIPATFLVDGDGKIIGQDLRGDKLEAAVSAALAKK